MTLPDEGEGEKEWWNVNFKHLTHTYKLFMLFVVEH